MTEEEDLSYYEAQEVVRKMESLVAIVNQQNGWFDTDRTFGEDMALLHSEVSEALEAFRSWGIEDKTEAAHPDSESLPKPEGVGSELADVLVRLLDTCYRYEIDLYFEFWRKMKYNATRSYRHGNKNV